MAAPPCRKWWRGEAVASDSEALIRDAAAMIDTYRESGYDRYRQAVGAASGKTTKRGVAHAEDGGLTQRPTRCEGNHHRMFPRSSITSRALLTVQPIPLGHFAIFGVNRPVTFSGKADIDF